MTPHGGIRKGDWMDPIHHGEGEIQKYGFSGWRRKDTGMIQHRTRLQCERKGNKSELGTNRADKALGGHRVQGVGSGYDEDRSKQGE